jgi:transposase
VSLVFRWRRQAGLPGKRAGVKKADAVFVPVMLAAPAAAEPPPEIPRVPAADGGVIEIELASGRRVRLSGPVDVQALKRVIAVLEGR